MTETLNLIAQCENCLNTWHPYGRFNQTRVPHTGKVLCPKCNHEQITTWLDSETQTKLTQKELKLDENLSKKISELEQKISFLEKDLELEKKKRELFEIRLEKFSIWAEEREQDFQQIERFAEELDDEENFRNDNK